MTRDQLEKIAFWNQKVCLDCSTVHELDETQCEACGSAELAEASLALKVLGLLERGEEE